MHMSKRCLRLSFVWVRVEDLKLLQIFHHSSRWLDKGGSGNLGQIYSLVYILYFCPSLQRSTISDEKNMQDMIIFYMVQSCVELKCSVLVLCHRKCKNKQLLK